MTTKPGKATLVAEEHSSVDMDFHKTLQNTIEALPNGTARGSDGIYYEMLTAAEKETALCFSHIWKACGKIAHTPTDLRRGLLVLIYKKGDPETPNHKTTTTKR